LDSLVQRLFFHFLQLCLLRTKPQDLPVSRFLFGSTLFAAVLTAMPLLVGPLGGMGPALGAVLLDILLVSIVLLGALRMLAKAERFIQTATAIFGAGAVINLFSLPLVVVLDSSASPSAAQAVGALAYLLVIAWSLVVTGHILRHAFNIRMAGGVMLALVYFILVNLLVQQLFQVV
jgi:hypothetical protein